MVHANAVDAICTAKWSGIAFILPHQGMPRDTLRRIVDKIHLKYSYLLAAQTVLLFFRSSTSMLRTVC